MYILFGIGNNGPERRGNQLIQTLPIRNNIYILSVVIFYNVVTF